ncbi:hypothetical protein MTR_3g090360 [Medicago truncatula]|uniref:Uncharacterized protein n=1 Tax=Medicago truncatula TaxID=3880 RepID=G7J660_MEDTR|nr:hypothetical protein MTR_3g090360 [Medicago truncatula]
MRLTLNNVGRKINHHDIQTMKVAKSIVHHSSHWKNKIILMFFMSNQYDFWNVVEEGYTPMVL